MLKINLVKLYQKIYFSSYVCLQEPKNRLSPISCNASKYFIILTYVFHLEIFAITLLQISNYISENKYNGNITIDSTTENHLGMVPNLTKNLFYLRSKRQVLPS